MCTKVQGGLGKLIRPLETHINISHVTSLWSIITHSYILLYGLYSSEIVGLRPHVQKREKEKIVDALTFVLDMFDQPLT